MAVGRVVEALRTAGITVLLPETDPAPDADWLPRLARRGAVLITLDPRIQDNPLAQQALLRSGVGAFVLVGKHLTGPLLLENLLRVLPRLKTLTRTLPRPFIAKIYPDGRVQRLTVG